MTDAEPLGDRPLGRASGNEQQHVGLPAGEPETHEPVTPRAVDRGRVAQHIGEADRIAVGLDQERPGVSEQVPLGVAEVVIAATERDPEDTAALVRQGECELELDAEFGVHHHVGEAPRSPVESACVVGDERILVCVLGERREQIGLRSGIRHRPGRDRCR